MNESDPPKREERRPFQFGLWTLLIVVLVLGVFFGWLGSRLQRARENRQAVAEVLKLKAEVERFGRKVEVSWQEPRPDWLDRLAGDPGVLRITAVTDDFSSPGLAESSFGDTGLEYLKGLTTLRSLALEGTRVTGTKGVKPHSLQAKQPETGRAR